MTQLPELSRHVDLRAVSARLNRALQPQGIKAAVVYQVNRLQIALEGLDAPDRQRLSQQVLQMVRELRVPVKIVELSGYRTGEPTAVWQQHLRLSDGQVMTPMVSAPLPDRPAARMPPRSVPVDRWQGQSEATIIAAAQGGDVTAIQAFVQRALATYGMTNRIASGQSVTIVPTQTQLAHGVVKLTIESNQYLGGPTFAHEIATALLPIQSDRVRELAIYKQKSAGATPFLIQQVPLSLPPVIDDDRPVIDQRGACPIGIKLIAGLFVAVAVLNLLLAVAMAIVLYFFATAAHAMPNVSIMFPYIGSALLLSIAAAAGAGLVAIGLGQRQRWGLLLSYMLAGLMLVQGGQMLIHTWGTSTLMIPVELTVMGLVIVILIYLTRRHVTRQFR